MLFFSNFKIKFKLYFFFIAMLLLIKAFPLYGQEEINTVKYYGGAVYDPKKLSGLKSCLERDNLSSDNEEVNEEVNEYIQMAKEDDLKAIKWLRNYYSEEKNKDSSEYAYWSSYGLCLGGDFETISITFPFKFQLNYDYKDTRTPVIPKPYLSSVEFWCGGSKVILSSSCAKVASSGNPNCYSYLLTLENGSAKEDFFIFQPGVLEKGSTPMSLGFAKCLISSKNPQDTWLVISSYNRAICFGCSREDHFYKTSYMGSTPQLLKPNISNYLPPIFPPKFDSIDENNRGLGPGMDLKLAIPNYKMITNIDEYDVMSIENFDYQYKITYESFFDSYSNRAVKCDLFPLLPKVITSKE